MCKETVPIVFNHKTNSQFIYDKNKIKACKIMCSL